VALDELVTGDAGLGLKIVDVLRVVGQQLALVLQQLDEGVGRGEAVVVGEDVAGDRVEDGRVLAEDSDVEDLLGVVQTEVLKLGVQTGALGSEVRDTERSRDAGAGEDDDVVALVQERHGVVDRVVLGQLGPLGQLPGEGQAEKGVVGIVFAALQKGGRTYAKGGQQLLGRDGAGADGPLAKDLGTQSAQ